MQPAPSRGRRSAAVRIALAVRITFAAALAGALVATGSPPAAAATPTAAKSAGAVPARALLQPADLGDPTTRVTDDYWSALQPPQPCGPYRSAGLRRADRAIQAMIGVDDRPSVIVNDVAIYRSDGAHQYLRQLRRAVATCDTGWSVLGAGVAGDESLLLRRREYIDYADTDKDTYVVVARTGRALVIVADTGWETADGHEAVVRNLAPVAVRRAAVVRR